MKNPLSLSRWSSCGKSLTSPIRSARSRKWDIPTQRYRPPYLFVGQKHIRLQCLRQLNGLPFSTMQSDRKLDRRLFFHEPNLEPLRQRFDATPHNFRRPRICQFLVHRNSGKDFLEQFSEEMFLFDGD